MSICKLVKTLQDKVVDGGSSIRVWQTLVAQ